MGRLVVFGITVVMAGLFLGASVAAKEIPAEGRISAVTVFPDRALVTQTSELTIPNGASTIVVDGLPASLVEGSLRVEGEGDAEVGIGSVESRRVFMEELVREDERRLVEELRALKDQERACADRMKALGIQLKFIEVIGQDMPKTVNEEIVRGRMAPETWAQAWTGVGKGAAGTLMEIQKIEIEQRALKDGIRKRENEVADIRTGRRETLQARISIEARRGGTLRLALSYQVPDASWAPLYDARLDVEQARVTITELCQVRQNTGADWSGVSLTLSTARPAEGAQMPELDPWFIDLLQALPLEKAERGRAFDSSEQGIEGLAAPQEGRVGVASASHQMAEVVASEFAAEYRIPGTASVPSDNQPHKLTMEEHRLDVGLALPLTHN